MAKYLARLLPIKIVRGDEMSPETKVVLCRIGSKEGLMVVFEGILLDQTTATTIEQEAQIVFEAAGLRLNGFLERNTVPVPPHLQQEVRRIIQTHQK